MRIFASLLILLLCSTVFAQWAKSTGGTSADLVNDITVDASGNVYIAGRFSGTADMDPGAGTTNLVSAGGEDIFFAKYNSNGELGWAFRAGGTGSDRSLAIAVDGSGNVYIGGYFTGTADFDPGAGTSNLISASGNCAFFAKYNSSGELLWAKSIGNDIGSQTKSLKVDGSGNVYITGYFNGNLDFDPGAGSFNLESAGSLEIFFAKYDTNGDFVWAKSIAGEGYDEVFSLSLDGSSNIYLAGNFMETADFDPSGGTTNLTSGPSMYDVFFAKYNSSGSLTWAKNVGGSSSQEIKAISVDGSGNVYITGRFTSTVDFDPGAGTTNLISTDFSEDIFFAKYNSSGSLTWAKNVGSDLAEISNDISVDGSGNVYITGNYGGTVDFDPGAGTTNLAAAGSYDVFFAKYDSNGDLTWAKSVGGTNFDNGIALELDGNGFLYIAGSLSGSGDFDPDAGTMTLTSAGSDDIFFTKNNVSDGLLPVELASFSARISGNAVLLEWQTATEVSNYGFEIERKEPDGTWQKRGFVPGHGNSNSPKVYTFTDGGSNQGKAIYRLKQIDTDGSFTYSHEVELSSGMPAEFSLLQNYPNPFNPSTRIEFALPAESRVTLEVLSVTGERVALLYDNVIKSAGEHRAEFRSESLSSGIYFYRLSTGNYVNVKKMVIMK